MCLSYDMYCVCFFRLFPQEKIVISTIIMQARVGLMILVLGGLLFAHLLQ